ncbi:hypothetical protein [Schlesneria sp. T3-172]|uniref:hypothetical protein n=1 Tax=Schlesneria sphaerica TaxID=3373610 RepID=UPI0037C9662E
MNYVPRRAMFGIVFLVSGVILPATTRGLESITAQVLIAWTSFNLLFVGFAFVMDWRGVFGKGASGRIGPRNRVVLTPYFLFQEAACYGQNLLWPTPTFSQILPDLYVGRLCELKHLPNDVSLVIDLTAELETPASIRCGLPIICLPTLDGGIPSEDQCQRAIEAFESPHDRIYICCANGHGRSVTLAAIVLGYKRCCLTAEQAFDFIKQARPAATPNPDQRRFAHRASAHSAVNR